MSVFWLRSFLAVRPLYYKAIVAERESEILSRLKAFQPQDGSIPPYADDVHPKIADPAFVSKESGEEYRSLNAELAALQSQLAEVVAAVKRPRSEDREGTKLTALRLADLFVVTQSEGATGTCTGTPINATLGQGSPSLPSVRSEQDQVSNYRQGYDEQ